MDKFQEDLMRHYIQGWNGATYHITDFMRSISKDLAKFPEGEHDAQVLLEIADVLMEDLKEEHQDD
jgi:hypothetical protein